MKKIKYRFLSCEINRGTEENPEIEQVFIDKSMPYSTEAEEVARTEAYNGEYDVYDDGEDEPTKPSLENRVENLETETSDLSEALEMILSGVTE